MASPTRTLLTPGNEEAWAQIDRAERHAAVPPADAPVETLLRSGMALSEQAFALLNAIERSDGRRSAQRA